MTTNQRAYLIAALFVISLVVLAPTFIKDRLPEWWPGRPLRLGLDLRGGSSLILGVKSEEAVKSRLNSMGNALRSDLKKEKIGIIRAKASDDRTLEIVMLLPEGEAGTGKLERLDRYMSENLRELMKVNTEKMGSRATVSYRMTDQAALEIKREAMVQTIETIRNRVDQYGVAEPTIQRSGKEQILVQLPDITNLETVKSTIGSVAKLEFRLVADVNKPADETIEFKGREGGETYRLEDEVLMTGDSVKRARVEVDATMNQLEVLLELTPEGKSIFDRVTGENVGRRLAIVLDRIVQSAPVIQSHITGGVAQITGRFSTEEANRLAIVLRSGALRAPLEFEAQYTVGASLGADAIHKGVMASVVGSALVVLFMLVYYQKAGALSVACVSMAIMFLLAILSTFGGTLTLPGIGGIALNIGMGVDASIIIFERIREELRAGATPRASVDAGFLKAHWSIMDSNLTTLISGVILYALGTGPIKGFALTLCIGVLTTMFCALFVSRTGFAVLNMNNSRGKLSIG